MKKYYPLLFMLFAGHIVNGQSNHPCVPCLPQGITFTAQSQIDSFPINYPNCTRIEGQVIITCNDTGNIVNLIGLNGLFSIGGRLIIWGNDNLTSFTGLDNLNSIGGGLIIASNDTLSDLTGLDYLDSVGGDLDIEWNTALKNLTGLGNLTSIGGNLILFKNEALENITGLNNVTSFSGGVLINKNTALISLTGLDSLDSDSISDLYIIGNNILSTCTAQSICDYLVTSNGHRAIHDNAEGCNSEQEIEDACAAIGVESLTPETSLTIYPNPASTTITIESPTNGALSIHNTSGQQILQQQIIEPTTTIDVGGLKSGVYLVKVVGEKGVQVGKFIKQ